MSRATRWRVVAVASAFAAVSLVAYGVGAAGRTDTISSLSGKSVAAVKIVRGNTPPDIGTSSTTFVKVTGATTSIVVPAHTHAIITATFNADAECISDGSTSGQCRLRIKLGSDPGQPTGEFGENEVFVSTTGTDSTFEAYHTMDRSWGPLGPGTYTIRVFHRVSTANLYFGLYAYTLRVERILTS